MRQLVRMTVTERVTVLLQVRVLRLVLAALGVAVLAQVRVPLPFTPVPITGQTLGVLLVGALLAPEDAGLSMALYALMGGAGAPVFAAFGHGWYHIFGPTGGYILGFIPAAWMVSTLMRVQGLRHPWRVWLALVAGNVTIYLFGLPWLSAFVGWRKAWALGLVPFIPGDLFKLLLAGVFLLARTPRRL